ncbi:MAG: YfdX family protein [Burkholderiales bacterium]
MCSSKHRAPLARSLTCCSVALTLGLLAAGCDRERGRTHPAATSTEHAPGSSSRTSAPSADAEPYAALAVRRRALVADAAEALDETYAALGLLARNDLDGAADALARATGKLEVVLAAEPTLALAPVAVDVRSYDLVASPTAVEALRKTAEEALDDGRLQEGRKLIEGLASEHVFSVTSLPLATYPDALKQAASLIKDGRPQEAVAILDAALATLVVEETIVPLPLVRAELLLDRARPAAEQAQRPPEEAVRVRALLAEARQQLDLARALGYATRAQLDDLYDALEGIEDKTKDQGSARGLFDRLEGLFARAKQSANAGKANTGKANAGNATRSPDQTPETAN